MQVGLLTSGVGFERIGNALYEAILDAMRAIVAIEKD